MPYQQALDMRYHYLGLALQCLGLVLALVLRRLILQGLALVLALVLRCLPSTQSLVSSMCKLLNSSI